MFVRRPSRFLPRLALLLALAVSLIGTDRQSAGAEEPREYDLVVVGGTAGGVACAVRAAREGLQVALVERTQHLGGFMSSGAGGWEAPYDGPRSPLYAEILATTVDYYRTTYGEGSPQHRYALPQPTGNRHIDRPKVEPRVIEAIFNQLTVAESRLTVLRGYIPVAVDREGNTLRSVTLQLYVPHDAATANRNATEPSKAVVIRARMFADATYEGDLMALAGAEYRVGRESRDEFGEPHAGVVYCTSCPREKGQQGFPLDAAEGRLRTRMFPNCKEGLSQRSTGAGDRYVMAYNYRPILTNDPNNRVPNPKPANYDPAMFRGRTGQFKSGSIVPNLPNQKIAWNAGRLIGPQHDYPEGDWPTRERISRQYLDAVLGLLWFLQHDETVPEAERARWQAYGLPRDEFPDNNHLPYEVYVREARRLVGRYVFTEHDGSPAKGIHRTPIHFDSVAMTDWPMDSVACTLDIYGPGEEGAYFMSATSRPAQVPYRTLLPKDIDNLLVPVCVSSTHVGWGAIRLEPVWVQLGESAGYAAAMAHRQQIAPAALDGDQLTRKLAEAGAVVSFFNDADPRSDAPWVAAVQYLGTKGYFASYDARPNDPLEPQTASHWSQLTREVRNNRHSDATVRARQLPADTSGPPVTAQRLAAMLLAERNESQAAASELLKSLDFQPDRALTRGDACRMIVACLDHP